MRHQVLLVEDSILMQDILGNLLETECDLVGCICDGREVMGAALDLAPTVVVLDISLPGISGLRLLPSLRLALPAATIVMITSHDNALYESTARERGADSFVAKRNALEHLLPAIRRGRPPAARIPA